VKYLNLRIETAMQRMELALVTPLPRNQRSLVPDGQPLIVEIMAIEVKSELASSE